MEPNKENLQKNINQSTDTKVSMHKHTSLIVSVIVVLLLILIIIVNIKNRNQNIKTQKENDILELEKSIPQGVGPRVDVYNQLNNNIPYVKGPTEPPPVDNNILNKLNNSIPN